MSSRGHEPAGREAASALAAPAERVERVLRVIQRAGPPGVGARDVRECLLLQLDRLAADDPAYALARRIVAERLEDLACGRYGTIARALDANRAAVLAARDLLRARLRPFPTLPASGRGAPPPPPEVLVTARFAVELLEPRRVCVGVSPAYERLDRRALAPADRACADAQLARARAFLDRLDRRWRTIRAVAELLVERQHAFVARGPAALRPLTRREVADALGFHESTVSRAVADRHALLPAGRLVPLAAFFEAAAGPRDALARLIAGEPRPLSDDELATRLARAGHPVARRTVAKYRGQLGIPAHARR